MSLERIYDLESHESELLYSGSINNELIEVREWENFRWLHIAGDSVQTLMDLNEIDQVALPNIKTMLSTLFICPSAKHVLNLGLGGASLERYFVTNRNDIEIVTVEYNEQVIQLAKDYFSLPDDAKVVCDSADHYLSVEKEKYDIILCDIFTAEKQSNCLYDDAFYSNAKRCLNEAGVLSINILPESEEDVIEMLMPMKNHFDHIALYEVPNHFNAVLFATCQKLPDIDPLQKQADTLFEQTQLDLRDVPERLNRLLETL